MRNPAAARAALLAAVAATAGDLGQLWTANAGRPDLQLAAPPDGLIVVATLAGALGIPWYGRGYLARAREAQAIAPRRAAIVAGFGVAFAAVGATVHGTTGVWISSGAGEIASGLDPLQGILASGPIVLTLWAVASVLLLVAAGAEIALPQSAARRLANPLVLTVLFTAIGMALPVPWRDIVAPASVNVAHAVFFASLLRRGRSAFAGG
jgi:hypothetical protein